MIILSNFQDYYDFASKVFYNEDPRQARWERKFERIKDVIKDYYYVGRYAIDEDGTWNRRDFTQGYFALVICDEIYFIRFKEKQEREFWNSVLVEPSHYNFYLMDKSKKEYQEWIYPLTDEVRKIQIKYRSPIVLIETYDRLHINPKLVNLSVNKWFDPHQLYQKIEGWFTDGRFNTEQPSPMTDKQKIKSHGFDTITSFRNPVR